MPQCHHQAVLQRVADALHVAALPSEWASLAAQATKDAAADLAAVIAGKGYPEPESADGFAGWQERRAFVLTMSRGAALADYPVESLVKGVDPLEMVEKLPALLFNGVALAPPANGEFGVQYGAVSGASDLLTGLRTRNPFDRCPQ